MADIKYSYCVDENGNLIHINSLSDATRHAQKLYCLQCGQEMIPKLGKKNEWHFAHKSGTACDGESYLHKLAKRKIRDKFNSSINFPLTFYRSVGCCDKDNCPYHDNEHCQEKYMDIHSDLKNLNGKSVYDTCEEEVAVGDFRADLLLTYSQDPNRDHVFIEIYVTHKSDWTKVDSGHRIIETKRIASEEDIDDLINSGFIEGVNCSTYNFKPQLPAIRTYNMPITRFVLKRSGAALVYRQLDYNVYCDKIHENIDPSSIRELNLTNQGIDIWGLDELDSYQLGLVYLVKKGMPIRNCILCKYYKYNDAYNEKICILYKKLVLEERRPKQTRAQNCERFELNPRLMAHPLELIEKNVFEVIESKN